MLLSHCSASIGHPSISHQGVFVNRSGAFWLAKSSHAAIVAAAAQRLEVRTSVSGGDDDQKYLDSSRRFPALHGRVRLRLVGGRKSLTHTFLAGICWHPLTPGARFFPSFSASAH